MSYTSLQYFALVIITAIVYYLLPRRIRWTALMLGSSVFWIAASGADRMIPVVFLGSIALSWAFGLLLCRVKKGRRLLLLAAIALSAAPLLISKMGTLLFEALLRSRSPQWIIPLGLSFYSMQMIAYLADVYKGKIAPQRNFFKYYLFISFFPQLLQGPIPRYDEMESQLFEGHRFSSANLMNGIQLIIWGFFLKYMIADKAAVFVNRVFGEYKYFDGTHILAAAVLYSFQLYTDFLSCVTLSQGVAGVFGIALRDNFCHPYFATSIKDFWRRWHMSLSSWLRDYIYIPLGGNRKGTLRKYVNLLITFGVSGIWHGASLSFIAWGLLHGAYQIIGDLTHRFRERVYCAAGIEKDGLVYLTLKRIGTFVLVCIGWILFRANSFSAALQMIRGIVMDFSLTTLFTGGLCSVGLDGADWMMLILSLVVLCAVSFLQERKSIRVWFNKQMFLVRWAIYLAAICVIWIFGTYGFGFNAQDFIYGGF